MCLSIGESCGFTVSVKRIPLTFAALQILIHPGLQGKMPSNAAKQPLVNSFVLKINCIDYCLRTSV